MAKDHHPSRPARLEPARLRARTHARKHADAQAHRRTQTLRHSRHSDRYRQIPTDTDRYRQIQTDTDRY
eukprot:2597086-Alexandrium_andersonii.AAC.1